MRRALRHYWAGNAVIPLFMRDADTACLLEILESSGPVYTAASTYSELKFAILKAHQDGRLKGNGEKAIKAEFFDAVRAQRVVLLDDEVESTTEALPLAARKHVVGISPSTFQHLTVAYGGGFKKFVTCDAEEASICGDWDLRKISPPGISGPIEPCRDRISRCFHAFSLLNEATGDLLSELEAARSDIMAVGDTGIDEAFENSLFELEGLNLTTLESYLDNLEDLIETKFKKPI